MERVEGEQEIGRQQKHMNRESLRSGFWLRATKDWMKGNSESFPCFWQKLACLSREGNGTPLQYSCLENPMGRGAWWAAVHGVAKSRTQLSDLPITFHFPALEKEMATHSSVLAWRIPGTVEPGGLPSMGSHRVGHDWSDLAAAAVAVGYKNENQRSNIGLKNIKMTIVKIYLGISLELLQTLWGQFIFR